jgi:sterol desaturase/sphingolipid hydroxylase (fatty acid hydroxylase superfamily)
MQLPDFLNPLWFLFITAIFFAIITGRYFLFAGLFYSIFYLWFPKKWALRKLNKKNYKTDQFKREVKWSMITALIFSLSGAITMILWQKGFTKIYTDLNLYGWWYLPCSLVILMVLHETYYYWLHRWMHKPKVFKIVHKIHHDSSITSPFTAFSFHPLEGLLQAVFLPVVLMLLPVHYYIIIIQLTIMTVSSVINHLDIEIYPQKFNKNVIGKWLIGATHHSLHHKQFKFNFGLYFTFWDKIKKTESPVYDKLFETVTRAGRHENEVIYSSASSANNPLTKEAH